MHTSFNRTFARGFSMVELMVAMVIGLIGMIIIFQVFEVSEGIKRTTTGGGDAQQSGAIAMYVLEHEVRNSGMGFNDTPWAGCSMIGYDNTITPSDLPAVGASMLTVPVRILPGADTKTADQLTIMYGSQTHSASASKLAVTMNQSTDPVRVFDPYGYHPGDLILLMTPPPAPPKACSLMEVTSIVDDLLFHDSGSYTFTPPGGGAVTVPSRFNKPGGLGVTYTGGNSAVTMVYNLGSAQASGGTTTPVYSNYQIANNTLTLTSAFSIGTPPAIADNIVHMRAVYGLDDGTNNATVTYNTAYTPGDGVVDRFVDAAVTPNWQYVIAVRIAVVARSALKEKPSTGAGTNCDTTTVEPTWSGSAWSTGAPNSTGTTLNFNTRLDLSVNPEWKCYRYRVFEATIPLRNWVWSSS
ncbi:MAG TPA: PilW family protein [Burkholderiales bacterium]|nr:PilW family protein [Burkholderiales bacterium]